jgi:hypothetical protein
LPQQPKSDVVPEKPDDGKARPLPEDSSPEIADKARELAELLTREASLRVGVEKVLDALPDPPGAKAMARLRDSLALLLGKALTEFLILVIYASDENDPYSAILEHVDAEERSWLQTLRALFGDAVREAYAVWDEEPRGWRVVSRQVLNDVNSSRWVIQLDITTFDGRTVHYVETPNSLLSLAETIVDTLTGIPGELRSSAMDSTRLDALRDTCNRLFDGILPDAAGIDSGAVTMSDRAETPTG